MKVNPKIRIKVPGFISSRQNAWLLRRLGETVEFHADQLTGKPCDLYYRAVSDCTAQMISYHDMTQAMKADFSVTLDVLSGLHRVTVSKELKKLRELGLVRLADGLYRIKSLQALIDYCDGRGGD